MILSAKALLDRHPDPTEDEVREVLAGNLCRCTGYREAGGGRAGGAPPKARQSEPTHDEHHEHATVVGKNLRKVDGVKLVTGRAAFTDDIHMPGMLHRQDPAEPPRPRAHQAHRHRARPRRCQAFTPS